MTKSKSKRRRGRPITIDVARTDSGRISRSKNPGEAPDKQAKEARMRMHGVDQKHAATAEAACVIGRLSFLGPEGGGISVEQYQALKEYRDLHERYMKVIGAPDSLAVSSGGGMGDPDGDAEIVVKRRIVAAHEAIMDCQAENKYGKICAAIKSMVLKDEERDMIGDLRLVGNALHRHFFTGSRKGVAREEQIA